MKRLAICVGLTKVNPDAYDGWDGYCPGCDRDCERFAIKCHDAGFDGIAVLVNEAANSQYIKHVFSEAAKTLEKDDLLVLYYSGHGGQQWDANGDEWDGNDETLCLWDGQLVDDTIFAYLKKLKSGVRVLFVSDSCNSGTNYRGIKKKIKRSTPIKIKKRPASFKGSLIHFGGCADGRSSYGAADGGAWTIAILDVLSKARKTLTYQEWFNRASGRVKSPQTPVFGEFGSEGFADKEALT